MAEVTVTQALLVSVEEGYAALTDLNGYENWLKIHQSWKSPIPAEGVTLGGQITEIVSVMGMANKIDWTVTELDAPRAMSIEGVGMAGVKIKFTMSVAETPIGCDATIHAEFTGAMIVGPIGKAVAKSTQADVEESLAALAANLS